ncbi:MAG: YkgJ family cysteine cluster protein [Deltaproteobacteria bacterium]|nr:YkgJ family cysteine cluster protein [Deltaproteobacteria bacterium]
MIFRQTSPTDEDYFKFYEEIRDQTLKFYSEFAKKYINFMCKKGCSECCESFSILPLEYYYIKQKLPKNSITIQSLSMGNSCLFLKNNECQIYEFRPIMCITQGLPLLVRDESSNSKNIFICKKNENLISDKKIKSYKAFEYDTMIAKLTVYNYLFCISYDIPDERIDIGQLIL